MGIEGVTLLSTQIKEIPNCLTCIFYLLTVFLLFVALATITTGHNKVSYVFFTLTILSIVADFILPVTRQYNVYKCTIDDTVMLTKIYEKYEIVERDEDIWILKDKQ